MANQQNIGEFDKMHGLGNDFVIVDERKAMQKIDRSKIATIANRNTGIGCDQFIILNDSENADIKMEIYNNDGSKVESCGNASRCVVSKIGHDISIETDGGIILGQSIDNTVKMDMGKPQFEWQDIPLAYAMDNSNLPISWDALSHGFAVNVGNPHIVFFVDNIEDVDLENLGPIIENDPIFPNRINVNLASISDNEINLKVWERGAGLTRACGTGACASAVAAISQKLVTSPVLVHLPGGTLSIAWENTGNQNGDTIEMTGDAVHVFTGEIDWNQF